MKIYISYPYGRSRDLSDEELERNVQASIELTRQVILLGHIPFCPSLCHYIHKGWSGSPPETVWFKIASAWLDNCDAILYTKASSGCDRELEIAKKLGKYIFYSVRDIPYDRQ